MTYVKVSKYYIISRPDWFLGHSNCSVSLLVPGRGSSSPPPWTQLEMGFVAESKQAEDRVSAELSPQWLHGVSLDQEFVSA